MLIWKYWGCLVARLMHDRRGISAVTFGLSAAAILGLTGLGTEMGAWYAAEQRGQNAADAAASAGAIALAQGGGSTGAIATATDTASRNGFTSSTATVTVHTPPSTGPNTGNTGAVEVIIQQTQVPVFSALFLSSSPVITNRAVAAVQSGGTACALALQNGSGLSMGGNSTTAAQGCTLASNASGSQSIYIYGSATVAAYTLNAVGGCSGCSGSSVSLSRPASAYQLPTANPFAAADNVTLPTFGNGSCISTSGLKTLVPYETNGTAYCGLHLVGQTTLTLTPGTYFFTGDISIGAGSSVVCPTCTGGAGVTIIMTGPTGNGNAGSLNIDGNATVTLSAPKTSTYNSAFNGMLFYQDWRGSPGGITVNGGSTSNLTGGLYFPSAVVSFNGNEDLNGGDKSHCTELVGGTVEISGNASTTLDISGCSQTGTATAQLQVVRLLE
jgi:Flp pilus assembly protein TadG